MENIKIINNSNLDDNNYSILIARDYLTSIQKNNPHVYFIDCIKFVNNYYCFDYSGFKNLVDTLFKDVYSILFGILNIVEADLIKWSNKCFDKVIKLYRRLEFLDDIIKLSSNNVSDIENFLDYIRNIMNTYSDFCHFINLFHVKKELLKRLKYACTEKEIKKFDIEYSKTLINCDIPKLDKLFSKAEQILLQKWTGATTNIEDYKPGNPFRFLCHSVDDYNFSGAFRNKYVSCSLIFEKHMALLNEGYGFILPPINIIAASDEDLHTYNATKDKDYLFPDRYSYIIVKTPEEIMELCLKRKEENDDDISWNEIVIEGFNPLGIFCLTDGSKKLDPKYNGAYELKKHFPKLKVVEIDETLYLPKEKQLELLDRLIKEINLVKSSRTEIFNRNLPNCLLKGFKRDLSSCLFTRFWQEFMELKKGGNYTEKDIIDLYDKNVFSLLEIDVEGVFLDQELYTLLNRCFYYYMHSSPINIWSIVKSLDTIYNKLKVYEGDTRLDEFLPGLSTFLRLYGNISDLPEDYLKKVRKFKSLEEVNVILKEYLESLDGDGIEVNSSISKHIFKR